VSDARLPMILVTVGTDHHPFDRLVQWVDTWCLRHPGLEVVVQHGTARPPARAHGVALLSADEFRATLARADAVVCAGGPGAIMEARAVGIRPIVVPRRADLGEHVDDHQRAFAVFMADRGAVDLVEDAPALVAALDAVVVDPTSRRIAPDDGGAAGVERIGVLIDGLVRERRR